LLLLGRLDEAMMHLKIPASSESEEQIAKVLFFFFFGLVLFCFECLHRVLEVCEQ
jgi:hypothetical protein